MDLGNVSAGLGRADTGAGVDMSRYQAATVLAVPSKENGYFYKIKVDKEIRYLKPFQVGRPLQVGDEGFLEYRATNAYGLDFWVSAHG